MRPVEVLRGRPLLVPVLVGLLGGTVVGLAWPVTVPPSGAQSANEWAPPQGLKELRPSESEFATARDAPVWGGAAAVADVKRTVWRLTGIISDPLPAALVVAGSSKDAERVRVGGSLPDGGVIKQIAASGVVYALEGCTYGRDLYAPAESSAQGACDAGAPAEN